MLSPTHTLRSGLKLAALASLLALGCKPSAPPSTPVAAAPAPSVEPTPTGPPLFSDITPTSGISFTYRNGEDTANHLSILESLGGGVALIDFDRDGLLDVFLPGGGGFEGADKKTIVGYDSKLYRNLGEGKFQDVTGPAGLEKLAGNQRWFYTHGAAVADYDRDGWPVLLVTGWGAVALFHNVPLDPANPQAGRKFEDVTAKAGLDKGITWTTSAAFADLDGDGFPDLYLCQYVDWSWKKNPPCHYDGKKPDVCPPRNFDGLVDKVFLNNGKGGFTDVSKDAGLRGGGPTQSKGLGVLVVDVDGDGKPDIYVANDTVDNFLYLNKSKPGTIELQERGLVSGVARDDRGNANGSMGADAGDPHRTGKPSLWVTNYENELHALYRNDSAPGRPLFNFSSTATGIGAIGQKFVGWGTAFIDVDLDGWEDIFIANGHAIRFPSGKNANRRQKPVLLLNQEGKKFEDVSKRIGEYSDSPRLARGVGFGDLDNDGRTDIIVNNTNEPVSVLRGIGGQGNHWIGFRLGGKDHACTVGSRVVWEANGQKQTRFVKAGGSYASSGDRRLLFGLGAEKTGVLLVSWPDGSSQRFEGLEVNRYHHLKQGEPKPVLEPAKKK